MSNTNDRPRRVKPSEHRIKYHEELEALRNDLLRLGAMVCETVSRGTDVLLNGSLQDAHALIAEDAVINELSLNIEQASYTIMVRQAPIAKELRNLIATQKLVGELERSADLMVNVCKAGRRMYGAPITPRIRDVITAMSREAIKLLKLSLDAYAQSDAALAEALGDIDDELDQLNRDMVEEIFAAHAANEIDLGAAVQLALVARYYERIGDHAVNIGERVTYIETGWLPEAGRSENSAGPSILQQRRGLADNGEQFGASASDRTSEAISALERAVATLPLGLVVADRTGTIFFRNEFAKLDQFDSQESILLESKMQQLIETALAGHSGEEMSDFWGPPRRSYELRSLPVMADNEPVGATVVIEDVTERSRLNQVRRDFVANMSHELRTPVGAISVLAETLITNRDPEVVARLAERLHRESFRLGNTIEDLLALSRLESGDEGAFEPVLVSDIFADVTERAAQSAVSHNITLETEATNDNLTIFGDRNQLSSAVGNLVDNAAKYSEPGSTIQLAARSLGDSVELSVTDRGVGIPESELERIFERFYRVDPARSRQTGGTGLGLSIVRHVVRNHHGDIHVESREGEGSTFTLRFPRQTIGR